MLNVIEVADKEERNLGEETFFKKSEGDMSKLFFIRFLFIFGDRYVYLNSKVVQSCVFQSLPFGSVSSVFVVDDLYFVRV